MRRALSAALVLLASCGPSEPPYDRAALLRELTEIQIVPAWERAHACAAELDAATVALCVSPDATTLDAAQAAWVEALLAWDATATFQIGPNVYFNLGFEYTYFPADPVAIEANIAGTDVIDGDWLRNLGAQTKGLFALELLLFAPDDAAVLAALSDPRRCEYLVATSAYAELASRRIVEAWDPATGGFAATITTAGGPRNAHYPTEGAALSDLLTQLLAATQSLKLDGVGRPLGRLTGDVVQPDSIRARYSGAEVRSLRARLEAIRSTWMPPGATHTFDDFVRSRRPELADRVLALMDAADAALSGIGEPFAAYLAGADHASAEAAYERLLELERTIATEVPTVLGVQLTFIDTDGD